MAVGTPLLGFWFTYLRYILDALCVVFVSEDGDYVPFERRLIKGSSSMLAQLLEDVVEGDCLLLKTSTHVDVLILMRTLVHSQVTAPTPWAEDQRLSEVFDPHQDPWMRMTTYERWVAKHCDTLVILPILAICDEFSFGFLYEFCQRTLVRRLEAEGGVAEFARLLGLEDDIIGDERDQCTRELGVLAGITHCSSLREFQAWSAGPLSAPMRIR